MLPRTRRRPTCANPAPWCRWDAPAVDGRPALRVCHNAAGSSGIVRLPPLPPSRPPRGSWHVQIGEPAAECSCRIQPDTRYTKKSHKIKKIIKLTIDKWRADEKIYRFEDILDDLLSIYLHQHSAPEKFLELSFQLPKIVPLQINHILLRFFLDVYLNFFSFLLLFFFLLFL